MTKHWKRIAVLILVPVSIVLLSAQVGPTVFTPRLTVSPGPLTVSSGLTTVQDITINGTCTGCTTTPPGGSNTQVQYNDGGVFGGDAGLVFNETTNLLTAGDLTITALAGTANSLVMRDAAGNLNVSAIGIVSDLRVTGSLAYSSPEEQTIANGTVNDLSIVSQSPFLRIDSATGSTITGINSSGFSTGSILTLINIGSTSIVFNNEDSGSTASNRLLLPNASAVTIGANEVLTIIRDGTTARWRAIAVASPLPGGSSTQIQLNNSGVLDGDAGLTYATASGVLTMAGASPVIVVNSDTVASGDEFIILNGTTAGSHTNTYLNIRRNNSSRLTLSGTDTTQTIAAAGATTTINLQATNVQANGDPITTETSGSFTATFDDGCTTSPTVAFLYRKIGTVVTLTWDNMSPTTCTSDSITFDTNALNEVPAAIRPTSTQSSIFMPVIDNSLARSGEVSVSTSGNIQMRLCTTEGGAATGLVCSVSTWTSANLKSIQAGTMTYSTAW